MKKFLSIVLCAAFMLLPSVSSFAADNPKEKLTRGITNIVTAPVEIARQIDSEWKASEKGNKSKTVGVFSGFLKGIAYTVGRFGSGVWDVVSFPFKMPNNYEPLMKPDYVLDKESKSSNQAQPPSTQTPQEK